MLLFGAIVVCVIAVLIYRFAKDPTRKNETMSRWLTIGVSTVIIFAILFTVFPRHVRFDYNQLIAPDDAGWNVKNTNSYVKSLKDEEEEMRKSFKEIPSDTKREIKGFDEVQNEYVSANIVDAVNTEYYRIYYYLNDKDFSINSYDYKLIKKYVTRISKIQDKAFKVLMSGYRGKNIEDHCKDNIKANKEFMILLDMVGKGENGLGIREFGEEHFLKNAEYPYEYFDKRLGEAFIDISEKTIK